jgi:hypothetical protein
MITASTALKNVLKQNTSIKTSTQTTIEYNMNSLIDNITVTSTNDGVDGLGAQYTNKIANWPSGKPNPFKKLFPLDSVIKPFRPLNPGIKYVILNTDDAQQSITTNPKVINYPSTKARLYYPGVSTFYKYWVGPNDGSINLTVNYVNTTNTTKAAMSNKLVVLFDKFHTLPTSVTVAITYFDNSVKSTVMPTFNTNFPDGKLILYPTTTDTNWTTAEPATLYSLAKPIKSVTVTGVNTNGTVAIIEVSARWIKDISLDVINFSIDKESSESSEGILPIGMVTANTLSMDLVNYDKTKLRYVNYNRESTTAFDSTLVYLTKNAEIKTYINVHHSAGAITNGSDKYDKLIQGTFYIDSSEIGEYGEVSITALDSAKYLMDTYAPEMLAEDYPVTGIFRMLLDSVGFSNYNFNIQDTETSVPVLKYWWTDGTTTVWEAIQEVCRDIQMNAFVDENNILQFYSRDYIYASTRPVNWTFNYALDGTTLPNIIEFSQKEVASANSVKILWQTPITSNYNGTSGPLWESEEAFLSAGALRTSLVKEKIPATNLTLAIDYTVLDNYSQQYSLYNFQGYLLIDSEIIEFDAIEYQYTPLVGSGNPKVMIKSQADISKYRALSKPGYADPFKPETAYFKPTGVYQIKTRGALGTTEEAHAATANDKLTEWSQGSYTSAGSHVEAKVSSITSIPLDPTTSDKYKSYLTVSNISTNAKNYSLAHRPFTAITVPSSTNTTVTGENGSATVKTYTGESYFNFGTTLFIQSDTASTKGKYPKQGGGLGFFIGNNGLDGYFVLLETLASASSSGQKTVRIVRIKNGVLTTLADTQKTNPSTLSTIFGNQPNIIDVKVKVAGTKIYINAYINGFKISASDQATSYNGGILGPTNKVGLICHLPSTTTIYDYVYGLDSTKEKYLAGPSNVYQGQFSNDLVETAFGNIVYNANTSADGIPVTKTSIDEFGTVVREIVKVTTKFDSAPAYPTKWSTGMNKFAKILGSKISNFGGEAYVLNNSSYTIPLADGGSSNFYIYGNTLGQSGQLEYSTDESAEYANKEPIIFESKWIQTLNDARSLADWIKTKVINRGKVVNISIFGNPIITVGDIVSIKYPYNGFEGTEKLIVTNVTQSYSEGLETTITCRTL